MKDLTFKGDGLDQPVTFRVDLLSNEGNLTVLETYGLNDRRPADNIDKLQEKLLADFKKIPYTLSEFKNFAAGNNLSLTIANSDGSDSQVISKIITAITVTTQGGEVSFVQNDEATFIATATYDDESEVDVTNDCIFTFDGNQVANPYTIVEGAGDYDVIATFGSISSAALVITVTE